jgi:hypothetical protein
MITPKRYLFFYGITCVIANTPSCYVYEGLKNRMPSHKSSLTYESKAIPCPKFTFSILLKTMIKNYSPRKALWIGYTHKYFKSKK